MERTCKTCKFWTQTTAFDEYTNDGTCSEIRSKVTIEVVYSGNGGYVEYLETEEDFGCNLWEWK
jgi:hypothetical protein